MDPIELQIQQRINEIQNTPGFTNYTPSFEQNLQPQGIAPLVDSSMQNNFVTGPVQIDPKQIAGNILKNQGIKFAAKKFGLGKICLLYTSPSPRDGLLSRMPSSA